ncbi:hypothetical protein [Clostridium estertheticum]|uniref:hypothetical protein n=1 Tax=Clostridium estertheticum TaxID=238834 RepID=UPI001C7D987D|nr:hypothetical protein [Clostridium estertheticum]MBX4272028.1 hypothetical protein [Clostridium estertheticum]WLC82413.1 hypothetical protein KTC98_24110 [Clostridium estertheticum]
MKILENLKGMGINEFIYDDYYILEENIYLQFYRSSLYIKDLTNAMKRGKEVNFYILSNADKSKFENFKLDFFNHLLENNLSLTDFIKKVLCGEIIDTDTILIKSMKEKGVKTFNPFYIGKAMAQPTKWKIGNIVKAILSGQIYEGKCDSMLSDDYSRDAENNFYKGRIDLLELCKELIESPSGWWVSNSIKEVEKGTEISVNCYNHNNNTVYFNPTFFRVISFTKVEIFNNVVNMFEYKIKKNNSLRGVI